MMRLYFPLIFDEISNVHPLVERPFNSTREDLQLHLTQ